MYAEILAFLGLPAWRPPRFGALNTMAEGSMEAATRGRLVDHFRPANERLADLFGYGFGWDR